MPSCYFEQNDDPQVKPASGLAGGADGFGGVSGDVARSASGKVQPGVNYGLQVQPRYAPSGHQLYGGHLQSFPAAGWPYAGQQVSDADMSCDVRLDVHPVCSDDRRASRPADEFVPRRVYTKPT